MGYLLILLGVIVDRMFDYGIGKIKRWAERSLLSDLSLKKADKTLKHNDILYWLISLQVGKGNILARLLCRSDSNLKLVANARFQSYEKDNFEADVYEVNRKWARRRVAFPIKPNTEYALAVTRRIMSKSSYSLYPIGGSFGNYPLSNTDDYDLIINLTIDGEEKPIILKNNILRKYIKRGNPNIDND